MEKTWSMHRYSAYADNWKSLPSIQAKQGLQLNCESQRCLLPPCNYLFTLCPPLDPIISASS